jgi:hypothetical protein
VSTQEFILSEVLEMTGGTRSLIQLWTGIGLLQPSADSKEAGRGSRRRFPIEEVEIAAVMVRLSFYGSTVRSLRIFEKKFRARAFGEKFAHSPVRALIKAARDGDKSIYLGFVRKDEKRGMVDIFRWDGTHPNLPEKILEGPDVLLMSLAQAWRGISRNAAGPS